jgi:hypothetical protein
MTSVKAIGDSKLLGINLELCSTDKLHELGMETKGVDASGYVGRYRYVKFSDAVTYVLGHAVVPVAGQAIPWVVTNDASNGMAHYPFMGVVFQATVPTQNQYGWVLYRGRGSIVAGSASIIEGDWLKFDGTTDGALDEATEGTSEVAGYALATIADNATGLAMLTGR